MTQQKDYTMKEQEVTIYWIAGPHMNKTLYFTTRKGNDDKVEVAA